MFYTLPNGLQVILESTQAAPVVAVQIWVGVGSADETEEEAGLAHFHEHMLFKGTKHRGVGEIARDVEGAGGSINAWTSFDETVYHLVVPADFYKTGIEILADAIRYSSFDAGEMAKESEVILEEIKRSEDMPDSLAVKRLFSLAFEKHSYRRPIIGYEETVKGFRRDDMVAFFNKWYRPNNLLVVLVGDFPEDEAKIHIDELFSDMQGFAKRPFRADESEQSELRLDLLHKDIQESYVLFGFQGLPLIHEDLYPLEVLAVVLGQGESSRLHKRVLREKQVVNGIQSYSYTPRDKGLFMVSSSLQPGKEREAISAILEEILRIQAEPPTREEVEKAKTLLQSEAIYGRETVQGIARTIGFFQTTAGDRAFEDEFYRRVAKVTPRDVQKAAARYMDLRKASVVAMSPTKDGAPSFAITKEEILQEAKRLQIEVRPKAKSSSQDYGVVLHTLSNGIRLALRPTSHAPLVSMRAAMLGGLRFETPGNNGVTNLTARLLNKGTPTHDADMIALTTERMAASLHGFGGRNSLGLQATFLSKDLERGLDLFAECLLQPTFPLEEIERERRLTLEDIKSMEDQLASKTFELFEKTLFQEHPYRLPMYGTETTVPTIDQDMIRSYYQRLLNPHNLVLSLVGDIDPDDTIAELETLLGGLSSSPFVAAHTPQEAAPQTIRRAVFHKDREQSHIVLGFLGTTMFDPDRYSIDVMNAILSGQGGRLFLELRDKLSLAYSVSSFSAELYDPGYLAVYIGTSPSKIETAIEGILRELKKICEDIPDTDEVERNKRHLIGNHAISLQRNGSQASAFSLNELYGLGYASTFRYPERIREVTPQSVQAVARRFFTLDRYVLTMIRPAAKT